MSTNNDKRWKELIQQNREGQALSSEDRNWLLTGVAGALGLDEMKLGISRFTKRDVRSKTIYTFELTNGRRIEISGIGKLKNRNHVLDKLTESVNTIIEIPTYGDGKTQIPWDMIVETLLATREEETVDVANMAMLSQDVVREWIRAHVHSVGVYELDSSDTWYRARNSKSPILQGEWVWFYPQQISDSHNLNGGRMYDFYDILEKLGVVQKSKKIDGKVYKAYRMNWREFFADEEDLLAYQGGS